MEKIGFGIDHGDRNEAAEVPTSERTDRCLWKISRDLLMLHLSFETLGEVVTEITR